MAKNNVLISRYLEPAVSADLQEKMVFLAGPRQVGKTTLAKSLLAGSETGLYLTYDRRDDRRALREARWPEGEALLVLDELHKMRGWKRWLKGEFDKYRGRLGFLVTGSARMDVYRRGGDSLQGRYHHLRLHPFTAAEAEGRKMPLEPAAGEALEFGPPCPASTIESLLNHGGFPEPFLAQSDRSIRRWRAERMDRFIREDVRDLESVRDLGSIEVLADLIAGRVGSPLSINNLREDLEASHRAVAHWVEILDRLYFAFLLRPYAPKESRALRKRPKAYLWDFAAVTDPGSRFENMVAMHLLKFCHYLADVGGFDVDIRYVRDSAGRELDFLVTYSGKPWFGVEAKLTETEIDPSLAYFSKKMDLKQSFQVVLKSDRDFARDGVRCLPARVFLPSLF